jgi:LCP family protein required for cell wall assembly
MQHNAPEVNLLRPDAELGYSSPPSRRGKFFVFLLFIIALAFLGWRFMNASDGSPPAAEKQSFMGRLRSLVFSGDRQLKGESRGRINILFFGIGGPGHDGPYLTDTIILASIRPDKKDLALLSIPRDVLVEIPEVGLRKINEADAFGELKKVGSGGEAAGEAVSRAFDIPVDYYVRIDFSGFRKIIDDLGGVMIDVPESFSDALYPTADFGYKTVSFSAGRDLMDGARALQFVRSRHGTNGEGSDFARSRRQQLLMMALKDRIFSLSTLANPSKIANIFADLGDHLKTNLGALEIVRFANLARELNYDAIHRLVLSEGEGEPLIAEMREGAYVLVPRAGDWREVRDLVKNIFELEPTAVGSIKQIIKVKVEVQNGTDLNGFAYRMSLRLTELGFEVQGIKNAARRDFAKTVIYDVSGGKYNEELVKLRKELNANVGLEIPAWLASELSAKTEQPDFVIILGENAAS